MSLSVHDRLRPSITQRGKLELYDRQEKDTPAGLAIDNLGQSFTDTKRLSLGANEGDAALLQWEVRVNSMAGIKGMVGPSWSRSSVRRFRTVPI